MDEAVTERQLLDDIPDLIPEEGVTDLQELGWPQVAYEAHTIFVYVSEPGEPGHHFVQLLAYDAKGNEVGRKKLGGWER